MQKRESVRLNNYKNEVESRRGEATTYQPGIDTKLFQKT